MSNNYELSTMGKEKILYSIHNLLSSTPYIFLFFVKLIIAIIFIIFLIV